MSKKSLTVLLSLSLLNLFGCVTARPIIGPDGTQNQLITCPAIEDCYDKAREVCRGNYKIVNTSGETSGINGQTSTETKLLVKCDR